MANLELSNAVVGQAVSRGLSVQRVIFLDQEKWDGRSLLIEEKPCQIVRTRYALSNPSSPTGLSIRLYLPRTDWPDFMIYVMRKIAGPGPLDYYVIPRGALSKDTSLCPTTLDQYRDAWNLFKEPISPELLERRFTMLTWQLRTAINAALQAGLELNLIQRRTPRRGTEFCRTRIIIEGRRCTLHSLSRISSHPDRSQHGYVALRKQKSGWGKFQLYVLPHSTEPVVYVIPSGSIEADTSVSLESERLTVYKNNWGLLAQRR
jgi:hypothetical protein